MNVDKATLRRNRIKLVALAAVFFVPLLTAWVMVLVGWRPAGMVNYGTLVQPPVEVAAAEFRLGDEALEAAWFRGRWTMLVVLSGGCDAACEEVLDQTARVHVALNQNMDRVRRVLVLPEGADVPAQLAEFERLSASDSLVRHWNAEGATSVQLVDPGGLHMMSYALPLDARGLLKDFERLLRISRRDIERYQAQVEG